MRAAQALGAGSGRMCVLRILLLLVGCLQADGLGSWLAAWLLQAEAANMLVESAAELLGEAERLAAEGADKTAAGDKEGEEAGAGKGPAAANGAAAEAEGEAEADPGSGLEHIEAEQAAAAAAGGEEGEEELSPVHKAQNYAMRNLMNAGGCHAGACCRC